MCGRFALTSIPQALLIAFGLIPPSAAPRYNVAPTQRAQVIVRQPDATLAAFAEKRWGLTPAWSSGKPLINARAETLEEKAPFRAAFARRRCLVPATGFYEWRRTAGQKGGAPFYFTPTDEAACPFVFAGLWDADEFTIVTTSANRVMAPVHERMPVILPPESWADWLFSPGDVSPLLRPCSPDALHCREVGAYVNNARHEGEQCIAAAGRLPGFF